MHKDKPPGPFDFAERSIRYLVGFWLLAGLVLSMLVHTGMLIWREDATGPSKPDPAKLEAATAARRAAAGKVPPPDPPPAVKY